MILKKKVLILLLGVMMGNLIFIPQATAIDISNSVRVCYEENNDIQTRADVIITKYRVHNGKQQYRRWNRTMGYWVDSSWIDI